MRRLRAGVSGWPGVANQQMDLVMIGRIRLANLFIL